MLSLTTDYLQDTGDPSPYLKNIANAGFTHIHWCHQWNTDFLYSKWEIEQIQRWFNEYGLQLLDTHGSAGKEKRWASEQEYQRLAGVELVKNRIDMTSRLAGGVVIMHVPSDPDSVPIRRSLDDIQSYSKERGIRIAIENGHFPTLRKLLSEYDPSFLGLCYDSGHGNEDVDGLDNLKSLKDRLISVHINDSSGKDDPHILPFMGTIDWDSLARIMAESSYTKCVSMEVLMKRSGFEDEILFLNHAYDAGTRLADMIAKYR